MKLFLSKNLNFNHRDTESRSFFILCVSASPWFKGLAVEEVKSG